MGKSTLILHWARHTGHPFTYWLARRETSQASRQSLARAVWAWAYPRAEAPVPRRFDSWDRLFQQIAPVSGDLSVLLIFDEFPCAAESDPALPSHRQAAWDLLLQDRPIVLMLSGSPIGMMVDLPNCQAPLYGRTTSELPVEQLALAALTDFFPSYCAAGQVAAWAVLGGVRAYLRRSDGSQCLGDSSRQHLCQVAGVFRSRPMALISGPVREMRTYEANLRAVAKGCCTLAEIATATGIVSPNLATYLQRR